MCIGKHTVSLDADELELVCELGRGAYGDVHKMREKKTGAELAVKRIRLSFGYLTSRTHNSSYHKNQDKFSSYRISQT